MNTKWIDDLFYFLNKDYGTIIQYAQIGKGNVDYDTGHREDVRTSREVSAVLAPVSLYQQYLEKVIGKADRAKTRFLIRKADLPDELNGEDYIIHNNRRYMQLEFDDLYTVWVVSGIATTNARTYNVLHLTTNDQLELGDGSS